MLHFQNNSDSRILYGLVPALPVIVSGAIVIWQGGDAPYYLFVNVVLAFCGVGGGLFLWHRHINVLAQINSHWRQDESSKIDAIAAYTTELERLLLTISPILSQHVMVSREHTEHEIIALTSRFAGMVNELQQIVDGADDALGGQLHHHIDSAINTSRNLLQPVLASLRKINQLEHNAMGELQKLSVRIGGLSSVALDVRNLTGQINQLAHSVSDETPLTGDQGFAHLVADVRNVAGEAVQIDQRLTSQVNDMVAAANTALTLSEHAVQADDAFLFQAEANINRTLSHLDLALKHYREDVEALRNNAEQIQAEVNNVLVALQFQDRVSQILAQVENNLLDLQKIIEKIQQQGSNRDGNMLQVDEAVEHIEEKYKSVSSGISPAQDSNSDDLTFF